MFFVFPNNLILGSKTAVTSFYITNADWTHLCIDNILKKDLLPIIATSTISTKKQNKTKIQKKKTLHKLFPLRRLYGGKTSQESQRERGGGAGKRAVFTDCAWRLI